MERGSDKHGARLDEALEAEVKGLLQAGRETRAEDWNSAEPSGEDQPEVDRAPGTTLHGGLPDGLSDDDLETRSELASFLGKEVWPADREALRGKAMDQHAPDRVIDLLDQLPGDAEFGNLAEVWATLSGALESHRF
ncbi:MAG: DUF2795 domain-containing protein [Actinomycetota bacterium]|nr:DUF2795 domain-containing protein [Actinomycetota bacterium]